MTIDLGKEKKYLISYQSYTDSFCFQSITAAYENCAVEIWTMELSQKSSWGGEKVENNIIVGIGKGWPDLPGVG